MMKRLRWDIVVAGASAAAIVVSAALIWRTFGGGRASEGGSDELEAVIESFEEASASRDSIELPGPTGATLADDAAAADSVQAAQRAVAAALRDAPDLRKWRGGVEPPNQGPKLATSEQRSALADMVAHWLTFRSAIATDAYIEWMLGRGYEWRTDDFEDMMVDQTYRHYTGEDLPPDSSRRDVFETLFEAGLRARAGVTRPAELVSMEMRFALCQGEQIEQCAFPDEPGYRWWISRYSTGARPHFQPPRTYEQVVERDGEALCAVVNLACRTAADAWSTYRVLCYFDPESEVWRIDALLHSSLSADTLGVGVEH